MKGSKISYIDGKKKMLKKVGTGRVEWFHEVPGFSVSFHHIKVKFKKSRVLKTMVNNLVPEKNTIFLDEKEVY